MGRANVFSTWTCAVASQGGLNRPAAEKVFMQLANDMGIATSRLDALRYSPLHRLVYVKNQKVGCTSIEYSLWRDYDRRTGQRTFRGRTHDHQSPIRGGAQALLNESAETLRQIEVFTAVRNPFSRALSAYLHHVFDGDFQSRLFRRLGLWRSQLIREQFFSAIGLDSKKSLSFTEFAKRLVDAPDERLTGHFRPQVSNILWEQLHFDFLGRLEEPADMVKYLLRHQIVFKTRAMHAQNARRKLDRYYDARTVELVARYYAADFAAFGYDPSDPIAAPQGVIHQPPGRLLINEFLHEASRR